VVFVAESPVVIFITPTNLVAVFSLGWALRPSFFQTFDVRKLNIQIFLRSLQRSALRTFCRHWSQADLLHAVILSF